MARLFMSLKVEWIYLLRYETRDRAKLAIVNWIEGFYNQKRLHSSIDYQAPVDVESILVAASSGVRGIGAGSYSLTQAPMN